MAQTRTITFPDGDYPTRLDNAYQALMRAVEAEEKGIAGPRTNDEGAASVELAHEYNALKAESDADAAEKRRIVTLRALGRSKWRELQDKHPARLEGEGVDKETAQNDQIAGVNSKTVEDDLVFASISEPKFTSRADYDEWVDTLSPGEFDMLVKAAWGLSRIPRADPKSLPPSLTQSVGGN